MNPQDNNSPNGDGEQGNNSPNFDGFGGPNISYENYKEAPAQPTPAPTQPAINVVNANGVISGRKMVDYLWQRLAYCGLVFSLVLLIVVLVGNANTDRTKMEVEKNTASNQVKGIYDILGVNSQEEAIETLTKEKELLNGGDLLKIDTLLRNKYDNYYELDFADSNLSFVRINNVYKVVSLAVKRPTGTIRVILYGRIANGEWKLGGFDSTNSVDPCANSSDEEKEAIKGIFTCGEPVEEEEDEKSKTKSQKDDSDTKKDDDKTKTEE